MTAKQPQRLKGRVALVTGASRGIGAAVAKAFAAEGAHVVLLARTQGGLEETDDVIRAAGGSATLLPCDLSQVKKIPPIREALFARFGKLDILVGNAAMMGPLSPVAASDEAVFDEVFRVNFFANVQLLRALDPLLRASDAGRAIFVTSSAGVALPFFSAYAASKAALEKMVATYAAEVAYSGVKANIIDPGTVRTQLRREAYPGEKAESLPLPETVAERFIALAEPACPATGQLVRAA
jgi:NAD(P)-dependent dehydrogenase (short-subunit alcohol dehydrogenase family)